MTAESIAAADFAADIAAAIADARGFNPDMPALADLILISIGEAASQRAEGRDPAPGALPTLVHALQQADADYVSAAESKEGTARYAASTLADVILDEPDADARAAAGSARRILFAVADTIAQEASRTR